MSQTPPEESGAGTPSRDQRDLLSQSFPAVGDAALSSTHLAQAEGESAMAPRRSRPGERDAQDEQTNRQSLVPSSAASLGIAGGREPTLSQIRRVSRRASTNPYASETRGGTARGDEEEVASGPPVAGPSRLASAAASPSTSDAPARNLALSVPTDDDVVGGPLGRDRRRSNTAVSIGARQFELSMLQQPRVGAELGLVRNTLGRLPIVPAPIVEVSVLNEAGERTDTELPFLFCSALLREADGTSPVEVVRPPERSGGARQFSTARGDEEWSALVGQLVRNPRRVEDTDGQPRSVFVFEDVSVRTRGTYRLEFMLGEARRPSSPRLAAVVSDPFEVVAWEDYPGIPREEIVPDLSMHLHEQGIPIWMPPLHTTRADDGRPSSADGVPQSTTS